jgi:hypothetical protein
MSAGGLPSACWCCGATAEGLRRRAKPLRVRPLSQQAAAALVVQQKPLAQAVGGLLPGHAATHSLDVLCNLCSYENDRQLEALTHLNEWLEQTFKPTDCHGVTNWGS